MAYIREIIGKKGKTYEAQIRKTVKNKPICLSETFEDWETANLWSILKEMCIDEQEQFELKREQTLRFCDIVKEKYKDDIKCFNYMTSYFSTFLDRFYCEITYDEFLNHANEKLEDVVTKGGSRKNGTGVIKKTTPGGVLRKFAILSAAVSNAISLGYNLDNLPLKIVAYLRPMTKGNENDKEDG